MREHGSSQPTGVELEILRIIWDLEPCPVREIHTRLSQIKDTNYSTTVKMLSLMMAKGLITRDEEASPHLYRALLSRKNAGKKLLGELIEKVFEGSAMSLVLQALSTGKTSPKEIEEVRKLLDSLEGKK